MGSFPRPALLLCIAACGRFGFDGHSGTGGDGAAGDDGPGPGMVRATVTITGKGAVQVAGTWCAADCTVDVPVGQPVTTMTVPRDGWRLGAVVCPACSAPAASFTIDASFTAAPITANRAFVTSVAPQLPFGGLGGADAFCTARANAASLGGTWVAALPATGITVPSRLAGSRGWVRMDGAPVIDLPADVWVNQVYPITLDENGNPRPGALVAGGANDMGGAVATRNCTDWVTTTGQVEVRLPTFAGGTNQTTSGTVCSNIQAAFCFETGKSVPVAPTPFPYGRRIFLSRAQVLANAGLAAMDALCTTEATTAGLTGTFRALIATDGATAASRFTSLAGPWRRTDGVLVALGDLTTATLETVINRDAMGVYSIRDRVWTGAMNLDVAGTAGTTCTSWTTNLGSVQGTYARSFDVGEGFYTGTFPCSNQQLGVFCAEDL